MWQGNRGCGRVTEGVAEGVVESGRGCNREWQRVAENDRE